MSQPIVISFASGKGGVGKSVTAASLALAISKLGKKTLIIDADFGGANLHTYFNVKLTAPSLTDYLQQRVEKLSEVVLQTGYPNLWLVCGHNARFDMANISHESKMKFLSQVPKAPVDYVIIDTGAGSSYQTIDAFLCGNFKIAVSTPSRPAVENMLHFLKAATYRKIKIAMYSINALEMLTPELEIALTSGVMTVLDFVKYVYEKNPPVGAVLVRELKNSNFSLIINKVKTTEDAQVGTELAQYLYSAFGWPIRNLGNLTFDTDVETSERTCCVPTSLNYTGKYNASVYNLAQAIVNLNSE